LKSVKMKKTVLSLAAVSVVVGLVACSDDEAGPDVAGSCRELCTSSTFGSSRVDEQANETNCFCSGGTGNVSDATCTNMCNKIARPKAKAFTAGIGGNKDACQCAP
jgi:hypothetical protein